jgi:exopolysaccharide production protein ExoQ
MKRAAGLGFSAVAWAATLAMCTLIVFMIVPENFDYDSLGSAMPQAGSTISRLVWTALMCASALVILRYLSFAGRVLREMNPFLVAFAVVAAASLWWSIDPQFTARRLIRLATILLVTLAFVLAHGPRIQDVLRPMITAVLVGSIGMVLLFPDLAVERSPSPELAGAWHGLATQKNGLGSLAAIGTLFWLHAAMSREVRWFAAAGGLAVSLVCLLCSRSSTAILTTAFTAPLLMILLRPPRGLRRYVSWIAGLCASGLMLYSLAVLRLIPGFGILLSPIGTLTDKDPSFSGRTAIWNIVSEHIALNPVLGGGFGAYWVGPITGTASYEHVTRLFFYPTEAHNGVLDVVNDLGMLGGICLLGYLIVYLRQSLHLFARRRTLGALYLGLFFMQAIENMSESRWFNVLCVQFVILTLATVALARAQLDIRLQERVRNHAYGPGTARRRAISAWA